MKKYFLSAFSLILVFSLYSISALYTGTISVGVGDSPTITVGESPSFEVTDGSSGGGSSGGNSGSGSSGTKNTVIYCEENWQCTEWDECIEGEQTRNCIDLHECGTIVNRPAITEECEIEISSNSFLTGNVIGGITDFAKSKSGIATIIGTVLAICGAFVFFKFKK